MLLHLAAKAFAPGRVPFPVLHVDTGHNFPEVIDYRDRVVAQHGVQLEIASVQAAIDAGRAAEEVGPRASRNRLQTVALLDHLIAHRVDVAFGGGRRDEEKARAKERILSFRDAFGQWEPKAQRPEPWTRSTPASGPGSTCGPSRCRTGPSSTSGATCSARASSCPGSTSPTAGRCSDATACCWRRTPR
ncbi:MAG: phosphoadenosine phosphosulfate reductase family protein [Acidimicrobiales bacterium]